MSAARKDRDWVVEIGGKAPPNPPAAPTPVASIPLPPRPQTAPSSSSSTFSAAKLALRLADHWRLSDEQACTLLGELPAGTWATWKSGDHAAIDATELPAEEPRPPHRAARHLHRTARAARRRRRKPV